ncbi:MAG: VOC family protein [Parafilimonas terrae]|nr:VOC family protein [Parafilimonas terrae]
MSGVRAILRFDRTVADLDRTEEFYRDGLGFVREGAPAPLSRAEAEALGLMGRRTARLRLRLNRQVVTFLTVDPPGAPYPAAPSATDPFFQHLAIPVREMGAAFARLSTVSPVPISRDGPQRLPESSGGVSAYKFRDPDGHPLELIHFPGGAAAEHWANAPGLFLGIDHSAITVTDCDAAIGFLTGPLGLTVAQRGLNRGPEQARLDGLDDPVVDVIALEPPQPTPHVELLHYRSPLRSGSVPKVDPADRASTRYVFAVEDVAALAQALTARGFPVTVSGDGHAGFVTGPDGHGCLIVEESGAAPAEP